MADISFIPQEYRGGFGIKTIFSKIAILILGLSLLALAVYGGFFLFNKSLKTQLGEIQNQIEELNKKRDSDFEKKVVSLEKGLDGLKIILKNHVYWSNLFSDLEKLTVPSVSFSDLQGSIRADGSIDITLNGSAPSYTYLAKQMVGFGQEKLVSNIEVNGIKLGTEGGVMFALNINFLKDTLLLKQ